MAQSCTTVSPLGSIKLSLILCVNVCRQLLKPLGQVGVIGQSWCSVMWCVCLYTNQATSLADLRGCLGRWFVSRHPHEWLWWCRVSWSKSLSLAVSGFNAVAESVYVRVCLQSVSTPSMYFALLTLWVNTWNNYLIKEGQKAQQVDTFSIIPPLFSQHVLWNFMEVDFCILYMSSSPIATLFSKGRNPYYVIERCKYLVSINK